MTSPAQVAANQANARKSTGPRTAEGKARSSRNHTTHGLRSKEFIVPAGQEQDFDNFMTALRNDVQPVGALEHDLFTQLAHASWTLRRCREAEADLQFRGLAPACDPFQSPDCHDRLRLIDLYTRRAEGSYSRLLRELKSLQNARQFRGECDGELTIGENMAPLSSDIDLLKPRILDAKVQRAYAQAEATARIQEVLTRPPDFAKLYAPQSGPSNPIPAPARAAAADEPLKPIHAAAQA
jgi:hypothetical protein